MSEKNCFGIPCEPPPPYSVDDLADFLAAPKNKDDGDVAAPKSKNDGDVGVGEAPENKDDGDIAAPKSKDDGDVAAPESKDDGDVVAPESKDDGDVAAPESKEDEDYAEPESKEDRDIEQGDVKMDLSIVQDDDDESKDDTVARMMIQVQPSETKTRPPADICVVVDISGSMGSDATIQNEKGGVESKGFSILDIVKHAVRTIINILDDNDRMSLIVFDSMAETIFTLTNMNAKGKKRAEKALKTLEPKGNTNIWDGLSTGLDTLDKGKDQGHIAHLLLLTDGEPNVVPPRGHLPMLKLYKKKHPDLKFTINTFGFGYDLDSKLLCDFARQTDGIYSFIPDSGFVGTVFVNAISNLLVTVARKTNLSIQLHKGAQIVNVLGALGGLSISEKDGITTMSLGNLQSGQPRDIVVRMQVPKGSSGPYLSASLAYEQYGCDGPSSCEIKHVSDGGKELEVATCRLIFIDALAEVIQLMDDSPVKARDAVKQLAKDIKASSAIKDKRVSTLLEDVQGQVTLAVSKDKFYKKWGVHYLPSLMRAHLLQQCNNFKDPGVQGYGGQVFQEVRDAADEMFLKLPPPTPSNDYLGRINNQIYSPAYSNPIGTSGITKRVNKKSTSRAAPRVASMAPYYNFRGGCVHGESLVLMGNGEHKSAKLVRKGDQVLCGPTNATVVCVVKYNCQSGSYLCELDGGLRITPWHPVRINGKWNFPQNLIPAKKTPDCNAVYSFVLSDGHVMIINGVECVSLGHDFQEDVVRHSYFGSQEIVKDLEKMPGWNSGLVEVASSNVKRNDIGLVAGFVTL